MYFTGVGQAVLELFSFKVKSGNHQKGISFRNFRKYEAENDVTYDKSQFPNIKNILYFLSHELLT